MDSFFHIYFDLFCLCLYNSLLLRTSDTLLTSAHTHTHTLSQNHQQCWHRLCLLCVFAGVLKQRWSRHQQEAPQRASPEVRLIHQHLHHPPTHTCTVLHNLPGDQVLAAGYSLAEAAWNQWCVGGFFFVASCVLVLFRCVCVCGLQTNILSCMTHNSDIKLTRVCLSKCVWTSCSCVSLRRHTRSGLGIFCIFVLLLLLFVLSFVWTTPAPMQTVCVCVCAL